MRIAVWSGIEAKKGKEQSVFGYGKRISTAVKDGELVIDLRGMPEAFPEDGAMKHSGSVSLNGDELAQVLRVALEHGLVQLISGVTAR